MRHSDKVFNTLAQAVTSLGLQPPNDWVELVGGRSNRLFLGTFSYGKLVFKLFDQTRANSLFPNNLHDERDALSVFDDTSLAPKLYACVDTNAGPCIVYDYVDGVVLSQATHQTIEALSRVHAHKTPRAFRHIPSAPDAILDHGMALLAQDTSDRAKWLCANVPQVPDVSVMPEGSVCFLHGDPTPANTVQTRAGVTFIDWQCPAIGDPVYDLAIALSAAMHVVDGAEPLSGLQINALLDVYANAEVAQRYRAMAPLYQWRMACYCHWKAQSGEAEYAAAGLAEFS